MNFVKINVWVNVKELFKDKILHIIYTTQESTLY